MSLGQQAGNSQQASQTWTEPPWCGFIETTGDALLILEAARRGLIPRVTRRLVDSERKMITSGSVFVFDEDESGIKRWTDGFFWSPSRILGNFLLYRETDKRGNRTPRAADLDPDSQSVEGSLSRPKNETASIVLDKSRERSLCGSLTNSPKFKSDGLMKKTFSLTIGGVAQHLISYYKIEDVENGRLRTPSSLPELASLEISPEYLDKTHFRNAPKVEIGADGIPRYRGEGDESESPSGSSPSPALISNPVEATLPLLTDGHVEPASSSNKRVPQKRFLPYNADTASRTRRRSTSRSQADAPGPIATSPSLSSNSSSNSVVLSPQPSPPTYVPDASAPSYGQYPYYPPQVNYQQPIYPQSYAPPAPQYSYSSYPAPPAVSPPLDSEAHSPHSQGTASPDHQPQVAPAPQAYPYPYYPPPPTAPAHSHHAAPQPYPPYPAAPPAAWAYGNYAAPPPRAAAPYQHQQYQPAVYHGPPPQNAPQHDREHSGSSLSQ